jgi:hypothetical protein
MEKITKGAKDFFGSFLPFLPVAERIEIERKDEYVSALARPASRG